MPPRNRARSELSRGWQLGSVKSFLPRTTLPWLLSHLEMSFDIRESDCAEQSIRALARV
jgi:hypothetical protein